MNKDMSEVETLVIPYSQIIQNQATLNLITLGHVAHGKSTLVRDLTGIATQKHKSEQERNITIYLGYANAKIWQCPETGLYMSTPSSVKVQKNPATGKPMILRRHVSMTDCPGHESLMSTMISGSHNIDSMFLLIAGNDKVIPQPQTYEHLLAISSIQAKHGVLKNFLILQNKLDLIDKESALENLAKIKEFIQGSPADGAPILPISAQMRTNMETIYEYLAKELPISFKKESNYNLPAQLTIIRSFNVNKPNCKIQDLKGGVVGGSLKYGNLQLGDIIEMRPGIVGKNSQGEFICQPLLSKVMSLYSEQNSLQVAVAGGLIGIGLSLDPGLTKNNRLVGNILGHIGTLPGIYRQVTVKYKRINRLSENKSKIPEVGERLKVCVHSTGVYGTVKKQKDRLIVVDLDTPICFADDDIMTILRLISGRWKLDGCADVIEKTEVKQIIYGDDYSKYLAEFKPRPIKVFSDLEEDIEGQSKWTPDYEQLLDKIPFKTKEKPKVNLPMPVVERVNKQMIFSNFPEYYKALDFYQKDESPVPEESVIKIQGHLTKFITEELGTTTSQNAQGHMIINGSFNAKQVEIVLTKYIQEYLICKNCGVLNSFLYRKNQLSHQSCNYCNSVRTI